MGYRYGSDGLCIVCKKHTDRFCDSCGRYICDEHRYKVEIKNSSETRMFCKGCYEKGKNPVNADMRGRHPHFQGS